MGKETNGPSILVVDDEQKIVDAIDRELYFWRSQKDVGFYSALSGREALQVLEGHHDSIQVVMSDLRMASMSGDELIWETRRRYPDIRSILFTGYSELGGVASAVSAGITAFIQKPWETTKLIGELEKALGLYRTCAIDRDYMARLIGQMERTGEIQQALFAYDTLPSESSRYAVNVSYQPLSDFHCGGDFYDVVPLDDARCIVVIGDVSGHGMEAAFITGIVRTLVSCERLSETARRGFSPAVFIERLNRRIMSELASAPHFVITMTVALVDCNAGCVLFSNAGNLPLYRVRHDECSTYAVAGSPCGFSVDARFTDSTVDIASGDKIIFMTDGIVERGRIAGYVNLDAVRALMVHFWPDPRFNHKVMDLILEMFPDRAFHDDATLATVDVL